MKLFLLFIMLSMCYKTTFAQQNLFNVPSSEITEKKSWFFQQQLNITQLWQSNTNFCYGLGKRWEVGFNILSLQFDKSFKHIHINDTLNSSPIAPIAVFTAQKGFKITKHTMVTVGTQIGTNMIATQRKTHILADFTYINSTTNFLNNRLKVIAGIYLGDKAYVGQKSRLGYMLGTEFAVTKKLHLMADYIAGKTPIGVSVLGFVFFAKPKTQLSFGWQFPNDRSQNTQAFVFELTLIK